jgi:hypothetical protein
MTRATVVIAYPSDRRAGVRRPTAILTRTGATDADQD